MADDLATGLLPLRLDGVAVEYDGCAVLRDIDLVIEADTRTVVLGANGAGKSTLLRVMHGLVAPSRGHVSTANGLAIDSRAARSRDAMLFQRPAMLRRSVLTNVAFGRAPGTPRAEVLPRARAALAQVGLAALAGRSARVLSGGEQQRVAFARALVRAPQLVYLDEPTASIDPASTRAIEALIGEIFAGGVTVVMTTHSLAQARRLADRIVLLHERRIAVTTPAGEFFRCPRSAAGQAFLQGEGV